MSSILPPLGTTFGSTPNVGTSSTTTSPRNPPQSQQQQQQQQQQGLSFGSSPPPNNNLGYNGNNSGGSRSGLTPNPLLAAAARGPTGASSTTIGGIGGFSMPGTGTTGGYNTAMTTTTTMTSVATIGANPLLGTAGPTHTSFPGLSSSRAMVSSLGGGQNRPFSAENANDADAAADDSSSFGLRRRRPGGGGGGGGGGGVGINEENEDAPPPPPKISLGMISTGRYSGDYAGGVARRKTRVGDRDDLPTSKYTKPSDIDKPQQLPLNQQQQQQQPTTTTTSSTTIQSAFTTNPNNEYANWVVVYGFSSQQQHSTILHRFETYGTILQRHIPCGDGVSNYICLRYESFLQAEKALCQHGTFLECSAAGAAGGGGGKRGIVIIGVSRVDRTMAVKLGLGVGGDGSITSTTNANVSGAGGVASPTTMTRGGGRNAMAQGGGVGRNAANSFLLNENDILLFGERNEEDYYYHNRRGNVCDKILSWLGATRERLDGY